MAEIETIPVFEKPLNKWKKPSIVMALFGVICTLITIAITMKRDVSAKIDTNTQKEIKQALTDTLQNRSIGELGCSLNKTNKTVEVNCSKLTEQDLTNQKILSKLNDIGNAVGFICTTLKIKILPSLETSQRIQTITPIQPLYVNAYTYQDSLCVKGNNENYNSVFDNGYEGTFVKKTNPLKYFLFLNTIIN